MRSLSRTVRAVTWRCLLPELWPDLISNSDKLLTAFKSRSEDSKLELPNISWNWIYFRSTSGIIDSKWSPILTLSVRFHSRFHFMSWSSLFRSLQIQFKRKKSIALGVQRRPNWCVITFFYSIQEKKYWKSNGRKHES